MVGTLFVRSIERSERVSQAMQARGFTGVLPAPAPAVVPRSSIVLLGLFLLALCSADPYHGGEDTAIGLQMTIDSCP